MNTRFTPPLANIVQVALDAVSTPTLLIDRSGRLQFLNRSARQTYDLTRTSPLGHPITDFLAKADIDPVKTFVTARSDALPASPNRISCSLTFKDRTRSFLITRLVEPSGLDHGFIAVDADLSAQEIDVAALTQRDERWRTALNCSAQAVWDSWNPDNDFFVTDDWYRMRGFHGAAATHDKVTNWLDRVHPHDRTAILETQARVDAGEMDAVQYQYRYRHADGRWIWILSRGRVLSRDKSGQPSRVVGTDTDITPIRKTELEYRDIAHRLDLSLSASGIGIWRHFVETGKTHWDDRMLEMFGITDGVNMRPAGEWSTLIHPDDVDAAREQAARCLAEGRDMNQEYRVPHSDGSIRHMRSRARFFVDPETQSRGFLGVVFDVTEDVRKTEALERARSKLEHESRHDPLTGLPNRRMLDEEFRHLRTAARRQDQPLHYTVLHIDLDHFKSINDTFGHAAGDAVLRHAGRILQETIQDQGVVSRVGGDEFVVLLKGRHPRDALNKLTHQILRAAATPYVHEGQDCRFGFSIGIAQSRKSVSNHAQIFIDADLALYRAKQAGRNCARHFEPEMRAQANRQRLSRDDIRAGLAQGEFLCHYQPQFCARTRALTGLEALVRWQTSDGRLLTPDRFLGVAQDAGVLKDIDHQVLEQTLADQARWTRLGLRAPPVAVNVSSARLLDPLLLEAIDELNIEPGQICFELLETTFLDAQEDILLKNLSEIRSRGIGIEIDDFGSGHASILSFLKIAPDSLKIDRELIFPIVGSEEQRQILQAIIEIGRMRQATVVAEGIETEDHAQIATRLGCDILQGFGLARPMSETAVRAFLRPASAGRAAGGKKSA